MENQNTQKRRALCYQLSCCWPWFAGKRHYVENFQPGYLGSRHHNIGIPANRAGCIGVITNHKVYFCFVQKGCITAVHSSFY